MYDECFSKNILGKKLTINQGCSKQYLTVARSLKKISEYICY